MNKKVLLPIIIIVLMGLGYIFRSKLIRLAFAPTPANIGVGEDVREEADITEIATNLDIPWEIAFLPPEGEESSGEILISQRPGTLLKIGKQKEVIEIPAVEHVGEGGLLGMAIHPNFEENNWIYLYLTTKTEGVLSNRVERYRLDGNSLLDRLVIIDGILGAAIHDGGRIKFGPDEYLYIATGDAGNKELAQNTDSLNGKILRLKDDGSIPNDNPFGNAIYSYGHRNSQGLAWDSNGRLWATEHGPSGIQSGFDELNLIEKGKNYGWPVIQGAEMHQDMITPAIQSGPTDTWAPSGAVYWDGSIFFGGLRGKALYEAKIEEYPILLKAHFKGQFGRIRAVALGPNGYLYLITSNTDGRGSPSSEDDKLIRINPKIFRL